MSRLQERLRATLDATGALGPIAATQAIKAIDAMEEALIRANDWMRELRIDPRHSPRREVEAAIAQRWRDE